MVTPKARAKHEPFVQQTDLWAGGHGPVFCLSFLDVYASDSAPVFVCIESKVHKDFAEDDVSAETKEIKQRMKIQFESKQ